MKHKLRAVTDDAPPLDMGPDIYAADKAKRESIDWAQMHIKADRRSPVYLPDGVRRGWWK